MLLEFIVSDKFLPCINNDYSFKITRKSEGKNTKLKSKFSLTLAE